MGKDGTAKAVIDQVFSLYYRFSHQPNVHPPALSYRQARGEHIAVWEPNSTMAGKKVTWKDVNLDHPS